MDNIQKHASLALLTLYVGKILLLGCTASDVGVVFVLGGIMAVKEMLERNKKTQEIETKCNERIAGIEEVVKKQNEVLKKQSEEIVAMKATVDTVRLSASFRKTG